MGKVNWASIAAVLMIVVAAVCMILGMLDLALVVAVLAVAWAILATLR